LQARLIEDLIDLVGAAAEKLQIRREPVDLVGTAEIAVETARAPAADKDLHVDCRLPDHPIFIFGDGDWVLQAVSNVLVADRAMPGMDGDELVRRIRTSSAERELLAAALTAYVGKVHAAALSAGHQRYQAKPASPGELVASLAAKPMPSLLSPGPRRGLKG